MDKMERIGSGIDRMQTLMKNAGLREPVFESDTFFRAVFYRNPEYALKPSPAHTKTREKILGLIRDDPGISTEEMASALGLSLKGIEWQIRKLKKEGLLKRTGPDKGGKWEIIEKSNG